MKHIVEGVLKFKQTEFPKRKALFDSLATSQSPEVLFITCADSRIDPNLITQSHPGDLFICRNAGNVVPPHSNATGGMTASIEYAIGVLGVRHVVVCGHSNCGAMKGALDTSGLDKFPHVAEWLGHCRGAVEVLRERHNHAGPEHLDEMIAENVLLQIQHLKTHPMVAAKLANQKLQIHGWIYGIDSGDIDCYNEQSQSFEPFEQHYQSLIEQLT